MTATISAMGRVAKIGEVKTAGSSEVLDVRVAVDNGWGQNKKTDFFALKIWGAQAKTMAGLLTKGASIFFTGGFSTKEWGNEGQKKLDLEVRVDRIELGPRSAAADDDRRAADAGSTQSPGRQASVGSAAVTNDLDDEIPF